MNGLLKKEEIKVLEGQIYFTETGEMTEYRKSTEENTSDVSLGEVLEECAALDAQQTAKDEI